MRSPPPLCLVFVLIPCTIKAWLPISRLPCKRTISTAMAAETKISSLGDNGQPKTLVDATEIRLAKQDDEECLWEMLYYASHSHLEPNTTREMNRVNPDLVRYAANWGQNEGDLGVVAMQSGEAVGAAWVRLLGKTEQNLASFVDEDTPELAIAVHPDLVNQGIGGKMLGALLEHSKGRFPAIVLSARATSPAIRLYERYGFETAKIITNRVGTDSVKMVCRLPP